MDRPPVRETARRYLVRGSNGAYEGKSLYDQIVDDLVEESKKRGFSHGLALTRRKEREPHFPVTREPENPSEQAGKREAAPPERWSMYPIPKPPVDFPSSRSTSGCPPNAGERTIKGAMWTKRSWWN